jgi:hypothetical protein
MWMAPSWSSLAKQEWAWRLETIEEMSSVGMEGAVQIWIV